MDKQKSGLFLEAFSIVPDPRSHINRQHLLLDMLFITVCATICGAKSWEDIADFGGARESWFKKHLELPHGIPSHDAFRYLFLFLDPKEFNSAFMTWVSQIKVTKAHQFIAIDGKTARRSSDEKRGLKPLHLVSAWASDNSLVLGQIPVDSKSNEITAIPALLNLLEIKGCLITIDAMGCQKDIAKQIIDKKGDYVLSLKGNQGKLHEEVQEFFVFAKEMKFANMEFEHYQTVEKDHGRIETRDYYLTKEIDSLTSAQKWPGLRGIVMGVSKIKIGNKETEDTRFFITSRETGIKNVAYGIRNHWGIENSLHWVMDVCFQEDQSRRRMRNSAANSAIVRHVVLNLLGKETSFKASIRRKQFKAAIDNDYLEKVINSN